MGRYELSKPVALRFVAFALALPPSRLCFAAARIDATRATLDYLFNAPSSAPVSVETLRTPRFLGKPQCVRAPLFDPAGPPASGRFHASSTAFRSENHVGSGHLFPFEALSRSSHAPCVRFAAGVAPRPRNTRFRLVTNLYRAGFSPARSATRGLLPQC